MKKHWAFSAIIIFSALSYFCIVLLTDRFFISLKKAEDMENRAAVAIRDDVTPFQKWGTENFTIPYLERYYGSVTYLTQSFPGDKKQEFLSALVMSLKKYSEVDVFILAHDNDFVYWMWDIDSNLTVNLGMVYNTGCNDIYQAPVWLDLGAEAYIGHPGESKSPVFYFFFLRRLTSGQTLQETVRESNKRMKVFLERLEFVSGGRFDAEKAWTQSKAILEEDDRIR